MDHGFFPFLVYAFFVYLLGLQLILLSIIAANLALLLGLKLSVSFIFLADNAVYCQFEILKRSLHI